MTVKNKRGNGDKTNMIDRLASEAKAAIDRVMWYTAVPVEANREALRDIRDHVAVCLAAIKPDAEPD